MPVFQDILYKEFDWFAIDNDGNFALFATSGFGVVPKSVLVSIEKHNAVSNSVEVVGFGSENVWKSYSNIGFYVYDFSDCKGCYIRIAVPTLRVVPEEIMKKLSNIKNLPKLNILFSQTEVVSENLIN